MVWLLALFSICVAIVLLGRAHSRYLDKLDDEHARGFLNDPLPDARVAVAEQRREQLQAFFAPQLQERLGCLQAQTRFSWIRSC